MKAINPVIKLLHIPVKQRILVRFSSLDEFVEDYAVNGIYYATWRYPGWRSGNFPLKLTNDGSGIILHEGLSGTGKRYPGFEWKIA